MTRFKKYIKIIQEMKTYRRNYDDDKIEIEIEKASNQKEDTAKKTNEGTQLTLFFEKDKDYESSGDWIDFTKSKKIEEKLKKLNVDEYKIENILNYIIRYKDIDIKDQLRSKNNFVIIITLLIFIGQEKLLENFGDSKRKSYDFFSTNFNENENYIYLKSNDNDFLIITFESSNLENFYCVYFDNDKKFYEGKSDIEYGDNYQKEAYKKLLSQLNLETQRIISSNENENKILKLEPIRMNDDNEDY